MKEFLFDDEDDELFYLDGLINQGYVTTDWSNISDYFRPDDRPRIKLAPGCYQIKPTKSLDDL